MFIVFEGTDGAGKTTQLTLLAETLRAVGVPVVTTREPGGSPTVGPMLRSLLLHTADDLGPRAEALLFAADRAEHVRTVIRPALQAGSVVLCDRFVDSTLAYQGHGRGLDVGDLLTLSGFATDHLVPDLVVVCDLDPAVAARRQQGRSAADRIEEAGLGDRVRELLLARAAEHPSLYAVVDCDADVDEVARRIRIAVGARTELFAD